MAKIRIGFSTHFEIENELAGIGTDNPTNTKQVLGNIHATNTKAVGVSTFTTFDGFVDSKAAISGAGGSKSGSTSGEIIIEGDVTVSSGTTFTSGPENLTVTDNFTLPGISDDKPSVGTTRFNEDLGSLEFYTGVEWKAVNSYVDMGNRGRVVGFGGYIGSPADRTTNIAYVNAFSFGNAVSFGELTGGTTRMQFAGQSGNSIRGLCACTWPANLDLIQYLTLASEGNSIDFGNLTSGRQQGGVTSSSTRSVFAGGAGGGSGVNTMEYVQITTLGDALDFGDLSVGRRALAGAGNPVRGIYSGGGDGSNLGANDDFVNIASTGSAVKFRDSGLFCRNTKLASNSVRVVYVLGLTEAPANDSQKVLEKLSIASLGQTTEFGEMMAPKNDPSFVGAGNRGIMFGGWSPNSPAFVNVIEMVNITTAGNGVDFGDYNVAAAQVASTSDSHGGLGGF